MACESKYWDNKLTFDIFAQEIILKDKHIW